LVFGNFPGIKQFFLEKNGVYGKEERDICLLKYLAISRQFSDTQAML
jgi:hypothetical protein